MNNEHTNYYTDKITRLENEQLNFFKLSKEQITVAKTAFGSINSELLTVSENEELLSKGVEEMTVHINEQGGEIKEMFTAYSMLLTINEYSLHLKRAIDECQREYEFQLMQL